MTNDKESRFIAAAKTELDRSAQQLDELTIARLHAARAGDRTRPRRSPGWRRAAGDRALATWSPFCCSHRPPRLSLASNNSTC
jgi:hypothetical protein